VIARPGVVTELATTLMFLTRLPVFGLGSGDPEVLSRATRWFPLAGALVGALLAATAWLGGTVLPAGPGTVLVLVAGVLITGAFHEDGLADVGDSAGAFGIDRKLAIMRDSRVGTYGALALLLLVLAKFTLIVALWPGLTVPGLAMPGSAAPGPAVLATGLVAAHVASRWSSVWLMARIAYARPEAANRVVAEGVTGQRLLEASGVAIVCLLTAALIAVPFDDGGPALAALMLVATPLVAVAGTIIGGQWCVRAFGGITGDCLGAVNQLVEVAVLTLFVIAFAGPASGA